MLITKNCDIGNTRTINQDYVDYHIFSDNEAILVVCDGMGGHAAGEVASMIVARYILDNAIEHQTFNDEEDIRLWLHSLIHQANNKVYNASLENEAYKGMGTTVVVAYIKDNNIYICHVGDSRAYIINDNIKQITSDDTLVNALVKSGSISKLEARHHPRKNVLLQAVGVSTPLNISFYKETFNDDLFMCSDGLYNSLSDQMILNIFKEKESIYDISEELIYQAKKYGGLDNMGLIIARKENKHESN